ncbi:hypothetical protein [Amycolatopsis cihanbeyliensis]|nr:hypothetical protein [Amycolatopsis cihanbeyliensis]
MPAGTRRAGAPTAVISTVVATSNLVPGGAGGPDQGTIGGISP